MRKRIALLLVAAILLAGCGNSSSGAGNSTVKPEEDLGIEGESIWEAYGGDYETFLRTFKAVDVELLTYELHGGENHTYATDNAVEIEEIFYALGKVVVGPVSAERVKDSDRYLTFRTKDGKSLKIHFEGENLVVGTKAYTLKDDEDLWKCVSQLKEAVI